MEGYLNPLTCELWFFGRDKRGLDVPRFVVDVPQDVVAAIARYSIRNIEVGLPPIVPNDAKAST